MENGHFVPGGNRQDAAPRYQNKKLWAEILLVSDEACIEYVMRMCNDFEKGVKPSSSKKDKELGLELGVCCSVAAAVAALSFAVGCCFLLLVVGNGRGDCCAGSGFFLPVSPARLWC